MSTIFTRFARTSDIGFENEFLERNINLTNIKTEENLLRWQLASLKISSPEKILALIDSDENCYKLKQLIETVDRDYGGCKNLGNTTLYKKLLDGARKFNKLYCLNESFKKKMSEYQLCFQELREEFIDCEGEGDWFENSNHSTVCDTYKSIVECDYMKTVEVCGKDAGVLLSCLAKPIFNAVLIPTCNFPEIKELEIIRKVEAQKYFSEIESSSISYTKSIPSLSIYLSMLLVSISSTIP